MKPSDRRAIGNIGLLAAMALMTLSCTMPALRQDDLGQSRPADYAARARKITQIDFGGKASYAACMEPACPAVTRKTLPGIAPASLPAAVTTMPATPQAMAASAPAHPALRLATALQTLPRQRRIIVQFAAGSARLSPAEASRLDRAMAEAPETGEVVITGYTDNTGNLRANQRLARARARAVHDHVRARLPAHRATLSRDAQAACCFLAATDTPEGRRQNRRVEILLRASGQAPP